MKFLMKFPYEISSGILKKIEKRVGRAPFFLKPTKSGSNGLENPENVVKSTFKHLLQGQFALSKHAPPTTFPHFRRWRSTEQEVVP